MAALEELRALYGAYLAETVRLEQARRPGDGLLGFGAGPKDDRCHAEFADAVSAALERLIAEGPGATQALDVLNFMYAAPLENADNRPAYWMLMALHARTPPLAEFLTPGSAALLLAWYKAAYPRRDRFPAQKAVIAALKRRAA